MSRSQFLMIAALVEGLFGIGFLIAPQQSLDPLGVRLNAGGVMLAQILGTALIGFALLYWWMRHVESAPAVRAVMRMGMFYSAVALVPILIGLWGGIANSLAWSTVAVHVGLTAGFAFYGFQKAHPHA